MAGKTTDYNRCARQTENLAFNFPEAGLGLLFHANVCEGRLIGVRIAVSLLLMHGGMQRFIYPFFIYLWGRARGQPK